MVLGVGFRFFALPLRIITIWHNIPLNLIKKHISEGSEDALERISKAAQS